jgi:hypothetical protein
MQRRLIVQGEIAEPTKPKAAYIFRTFSGGFESDEDVAQLKVVKSQEEMTFSRGFLNG